jgi:hypothetical protein
MNTSRYAGLAFAALLSVATASYALTAPLLAELTFESGTLSGTKQVRINVPVPTTERARAGKYSMKAVLRAEDVSKTVSGSERNEVEITASHAPMNTALWYGFSVFLPSDYVADNVWELVTQWYPTGDADEEWGRQPTMALVTTKGKWAIENRYSSQTITPINDPSISLKRWDIGTQELNRWTDWVFNVRWTHTTDGFLKVWKDGKLVVDYKGPTSYNDQQGPFVKQGIYKGWHKMAIDAATVRTVYHDEFRMAGPGGSYEAVAPGGGVPALVAATPKPPSSVLVQ